MDTSPSSRYEIYGLSGNPFPYVAIPPEEPDVYVDQEEALNILLNIVDSVCSSKLSNHAVIVGPYGSGKSHTLRYLAHVINTARRGSAKAIYISHPGEKFVDFYREVLQRIGLDLLRELSGNVEADEGVFDVAKAISLLSDPQHSLQAWRWLTAERLTTIERGRIGIAKNVDDDLAVKSLSYIVKVMARRGLALFILIDELEAVLDVPMAKRLKLLTCYRRFIDDCPYGLSLIFASTPAGWDTIVSDFYALARRLSRNVIYLKRLGEEDAMRVVARYIKRKRIDGHSGPPNLAEHDELYPFHPNAIRYMLKLAEGNVGELLKLCNVAIDEAVKRGYELITESVVKDLLRSYQR